MLTAWKQADGKPCKKLGLPVKCDDCPDTEDPGDDLIYCPTCASGGPTWDSAKDCLVALRWGVEVPYWGQMDQCFSGVNCSSLAARTPVPGIFSLPAQFGAGDCPYLPEYSQRYQTIYRPGVTYNFLNNCYVPRPSGGLGFFALVPCEDPSVTCCPPGDPGCSDDSKTYRLSFSPIGASGVPAGSVRVLFDISAKSWGSIALRWAAILPRPIDHGGGPITLPAESPTTWTAPGGCASGSVPSVTVFPW